MPENPAKRDDRERVCFLLQVRPERLEEYKQRHRSVWPEMLAALRETGWENYSLFLRPDGLLVGYLETPNFARALEGMAGREINSRWQSEMAPFFSALSSARPDEQFLRLEEIFHLSSE
jgi:L-rhamnose mutarotase